MEGPDRRAIWTEWLQQCYEAIGVAGLLSKLALPEPWYNLTRPLKTGGRGTSLVGHWPRLRASKVGALASILGQRSEEPHV